MKTKCICKREKILDGFIKEMENIDDTINYRQETGNFYKNLDK